MSMGKKRQAKDTSRARSDMVRGFVHLHVHSEHSDLDSTARVEDLVAAAAADGQKALAITDHGSLAGIWAAYEAGKKHGVKIIPGEEVYLAIGSRHERNFIEVPAEDTDTDDGSEYTGKTKRKNYEHLTVLARSPQGWRNLVAMHNEALNSRWGKYARIDYELLHKHRKGLIVLTGCLGGPVLGPLARGDEDGARRGIEALIEAVGRKNVYVEIMDHGIPQESAVLPRLVELAAEYDLPLVATNDAHHVHADGALAHEAWLALRTKNTLKDPAPPRFKFVGSGYHLRTAEEMYAVREEDWWREACQNTVTLAERVADDLLPEHYLRLPKFPVPDGFKDSRAYFVHLVKEGAKARYGDPYPKEVAERLNAEMKVIEGFGVIDYFLIVHELINWARAQGIRVGPGRGCLVGDDLVWTTEGYKALRDVRIGDTVRTHTGALRQVANTMRYDCDEPLVRISVAEGGGCTMTADHKVLVIRGGMDTWVPARGVAVGDDLVRVGPHGRQPTPVLSVAHVAPAGEVFDIEVPVDHSYMTDSYVVHNSAAGSAISYALGIVGVDPLRLDLLFERFLDPTRVGMPDIDIDFEKGRRDEVLAHLVDMYGSDFVARIGTYQMAKTKKAIKDAARVLGHPASLGDRLSKAVPMNGPEPYTFDKLDATRQSDSAGFWEMVDGDDRSKEVVHLARQFEGVTSGKSIHACGTVVSDAPLGDLVPMRKDTGDGSSEDDPLITEWDADGVDDGIGLLKLDVLGLRNLDIVSAAVRTIEELTGEVIDPDNLPDPDDLEDERVRKTWRLLAEGHTAGVFQLESSGMTVLAQDVSPTSLEHLSALVALFRPGPLAANMHTLYAARKNGREEVDYSIFTDDPAEQEQIATVLGSTYGLTVYQEQMMLLGDVVAGFGPAERNRLRKAVSKKIASEVAAVGELFMAGAVSDTASDGSPKLAFARSTAERVWETIKGGASYAFNKCLTGETTLETGGGTSWTVSDLYRRLHGQEAGPGGTCPRCWDRPLRPAAEGRMCQRCDSWLRMFTDPDRGLHLLAVDSKDGRIRPQRVSDVHFNGFHQVHRITLADGRTVRATGNHRFMAGDGSYITVDEMIPGRTELSVDGGYEPYQYDPADYRLTRGERQGVGRLYGRGRENIGYVDGGSLALKEWTAQTLQTAACAKCGKTRADGRLERAHLDGDRTNNHPSNLRWLCVSHHKAHDYRHNSRRRRFQKGRIRATSTVVAIVPDGIEPVYDVEMAEGTDHNFLANGIVSHNSHSAAYGQLAYVTAFLKANWPAAYGAAILGVTKDEDKRAAALLSLAQEGVRILPPQVNSAQYSTTAVDEKTVVLGLGEIKDVGKAASHIVAEREKNGPFTSAADILARVRLPGKDGGQAPLTAKVIEALIEAGALDELGPRKGQMRVLRSLRERPDIVPADEEWGLVERAVRQHNRLGLIIGTHPMSALSKQVRAWRPDLEDEYGNPLGSKPRPLHKVLDSGRSTVVTIGLVTGWKVKPDNRGGQRAFLKLEGSKGRIEAIVWDNTLRALRREGVSVGVGSVVGVLAKVRTREIEQVDEDGETHVVEVHSLTVSKMWPLKYTDVDARTAPAPEVFDVTDYLFDPATTFPPEPDPGNGRSRGSKRRQGPESRAEVSDILREVRPPADEGAEGSEQTPAASGSPQQAWERLYVPAGWTVSMVSRGYDSLYKGLTNAPAELYEECEGLRVYRVQGKSRGKASKPPPPLLVVSLPDREWHEEEVSAHLAGEGHWVPVNNHGWEKYVPADVPAAAEPVAA